MVRYCTREDVTSSLGFDETQRTATQVDRAIEDASRAIDRLCHRVFYPTVATRYFDWPRSGQASPAWQLWLDENDLISVDSVLSGGVTISPSDLFLEPVNSGPPFTSVQVDRSQAAFFAAGQTPQHAIAITGVWGYGDDQVPAGTLAATAQAADATLLVTDGSLIGVGDLLRIGGERIDVVGRSLNDTGVTLTADLAARNNDNALTVPDGTAFHRGEQLAVGTEHMTVTEVIGDVVVVKRATDTPALAVHSAGDPIWASRTLAVTRAVLGTVASVASIGAAVTKLRTPVHSLAVAEAMYQVMTEGAGYQPTVGTGAMARNLTTESVKQIRGMVYDRYARKARTRAV